MQRGQADPLIDGVCLPWLARSEHDSILEMERLVDGDAMMDPSILNVAPDAGGGAYSHEGEEFILVLEGVFEVILNDSERYHLSEGDTL